jgi:hypothetical protein
MKGHGQPHGNSFLPNPAEPFADLVLPKKNQHFFFDHPRSQDAEVELRQGFN